MQSNIFSWFLSSAQTQCFIINMKWNSVPLYSQANDLNMAYRLVSLDYQLIICLFQTKN